MTILFIENRHKTFLFEPIANYLSEEGHDVHWLIQNKEFVPSGDFQIHYINYPSGSRNRYEENDAVKEVIQIDRQINHFKKKDTSYFYYYNHKIKEYLKELRPKIVFGEATAFHELLTIQLCKEQNILYLNPSTCRYPNGRFSFYKHDTLEPFKGSGDYLNETEAQAVIDRIVNRKTAPDYMKRTAVSKMDILKDKFTKSYSYFMGEKYNTPSPLVKYRIEKKKKKIIKDWDVDAIKELSASDHFKVLYPLQMQPEANIDVWGKKNRNQTSLIEKISNSLPGNALLYVKPNPKSKYELTTSLNKLVKGSLNIRHLHHETRMNDVLPKMDLVITVTGTIAIECILSNKPVITLKKTLNNEVDNCLFVNDLSSELIPIIESVENNRFKKITLKEKVEFINILNKTSYMGIISDPYSLPTVLSESNISNLRRAFMHVIQSDPK